MLKNKKNCENLQQLFKTTFVKSQMQSYENVFVDSNRTEGTL